MPQSSELTGIISDMDGVPAGALPLLLSSQVKSSQFIFLRIVQHEIFTNYDVTYNNYRKYAMLVMNIQTQDRRHKV